MVMAFRVSSSCARGLLAGDGGLTPNPVLRFRISGQMQMARLSAKEKI